LKENNPRKYLTINEIDEVQKNEKKKSNYTNRKETHP